MQNDSEEFVSPIAHWPWKWKEKFMELLHDRLQEAVTQGWNIVLQGQNFYVPGGDEKTSAHIIEILRTVQMEVEWIMNNEPQGRDN